MTSFEDTLASMSGDGGRYRVEPDENWIQGRTTYGGLLAGLAVEAARRLKPELPPLRSAQLTFIAPSCGEIALAPALLRSGRSAAFVGVDVESEGALAVRAMLTFGGARQSRHRLEDMPQPAVPGPDGRPSMFDMPGAPRSSSNFDGRLVGGAAPFSSAERPELVLWLRHRGEVRASGEAALVALADASPPAVFPIFAAPAPISTVTWSMDFADPGAAADGWFLARTNSSHVEDGYSLQTTTMWTVCGSLALISRQLVALYD
jgi:acyl-CoA thioesterase